MSLLKTIKERYLMISNSLDVESEERTYMAVNYGTHEAWEQVDIQSLEVCDYLDWISIDSQDKGNHFSLFRALNYFETNYSWYLQNR